MTDTTSDTGAEPQALPGDGLREGIVDELRRHLGEALLDVELRPNDDLWVRVANESWAATGTALRGMGFTYFCFLSGLDWLPSPYGRGEDNPDEPPPERTTEVVPGVTGGDTRFQVFARVVDPVRHVGITVKADVDDDAPGIASWHRIWAGANWHERETHEMYGMDFVDHPDLRNMYLPTEFEGHPLRKDFPLLSRMIKPWPGIVDVEPMPAEDADGDGQPDAPAEGADAAAEPASDQAAEPAADAATEPTGDEAEQPAADEAAEPAADETRDAAVADATTSEPAPSEDEPAAAPETAAEPAEVTDRSDENAPDHESTDEAEAETTEASADEPAAGEADTPANGEAEATPAEEAVAADADEDRPDAETDGTTPAVDGVESAPEEGSDVAPPEAAGQPWSPDIPVADVEGPYGVGSKAVRPDGSEPLEHPIKASSATMQFFVPGSDGFDTVEHDVWFDSETTARQAGFHSPFDDVDGEQPATGGDES